MNGEKSKRTVTVRKIARRRGRRRKEAAARSCLLNEEAPMIGAKLAIDEALLAKRCKFNRTNEEPTREDGEIARSQEYPPDEAARALELS